MRLRQFLKNLFSKKPPSPDVGIVSRLEQNNKGLARLLEINHQLQRAVDSSTDQQYAAAAFAELLSARKITPSAREKFFALMTQTCRDDRAMPLASGSRVEMLVDSFGAINSDEFFWEFDMETVENTITNGRTS